MTLAVAPRFIAGDVKIMNFFRTFGPGPNYRPQQAIARRSDMDSPTTVTINVSRFGDSVARVSTRYVHMFPGRWYFVKIRRGMAVGRGQWETYRIPDVTPREILRCCSNEANHRLACIRFDRHGGEETRQMNIDRRLSSLGDYFDRDRTIWLAILPR